MNISFSHEHETFREEVQTFLRITETDAPRSRNPLKSAFIPHRNKKQSLKSGS